jgi:predicted CopG family antitoxin
MSKRVTLSEDAYNLLVANRKQPNESLSSVILRFVPLPIRTFGSLEKHLVQMDGQLNSDFEALERVRERKRKINHDH